MSVSVLITTCYCMHTDDFNKSSEIVDICIYILFIISYVSHILLDILWKLRSSLTLLANGNYLLGYRARLTCSPNLIWETLIKVAYFVLLTYDSYTKSTGVLFHLKNWDKLKFSDLNTFWKHASGDVSEKLT